MNALWVSDDPIVVKASEHSGDPDLVLCHRPQRFGNPYVSGAKVTAQSVITWLSQSILEDVITLDWIEENLPQAFRAIAKGEYLNRTKAISLFVEYWTHIREVGLVTDEEVLALRGKKLGCFCTPKDCHLDMIVGDYILTKRSKGVS